jgi:hypothetical protein
MSNKTVWVVVAILVLGGLYYWMKPVADVQPASDVPATEGVSAAPATDAPATGAPSAPATE